MAELDDKVIVTKSKITDIADALREEMSESYEYSLPTMVEKVHELGQGQGSEYTAGVGIDITNRVVSVVDTLMIRGSASGSIASFDDGGANMPMKSCIVSIEPVQSGSGDPSPSNVRPITGWTEMNLNVDNKNLFDSELLLGANGWQKDANGDYYGYNNLMHDYTYNNDVFKFHKEGYAYTFTCKTRNETAGKKIVFGFAYTDGTTQYKNVDEIDTDWHDLTFSSNPEKTVKEFIISYNSTGICHIKDAQMEIGITSTSYVPYADNTYNIEFPSEAGTVYGGTLDVTNGVLTVTDGYIASYNGETLPSTWISSMDVYTEGTTPTTGAEVVYKLATPQTYNLTPTEVKTLLGINNIFADCGDVDVEYTRDATLIINKLLELVSGNNRTMMKSAVVEKTDEVIEQNNESVEKASELDA